MKPFIYCLFLACFVACKKEPAEPPAKISYVMQGKETTYKLGQYTVGDFCGSKLHTISAWNDSTGLFCLYIVADHLTTGNYMEAGLNYWGEREQFGGRVSLTITGIEGANVRGYFSGNITRQFREQFITGIVNIWE